MPFFRVIGAFAALTFYTACTSVAQTTVATAQPVAQAQAVIVAPKEVRPALPKETQPAVYAESAMVIDAVTGRILFQKNAYSERAVASTQKLLTALIVTRSGPLSDEVIVEHSDTLVEPSKLYLKAGEKYTRQELLKALLVKSGNDVALSLGRDIAGSKAEFAILMNKTARDLGMSQSNFINPHGLTEEGQYSTARDISILARQAYRQPFMRQCMRTKSYTFKYPDGRTRVVNNTNEVLSRLDYCDGMKTGTTRAAGRCLVSSGQLNGRAVIAVVLGSNSANVWDDSEKLLRWALE